MTELTEQDRTLGGDAYRIRELRLDRGLSVRTLAEKAGLDRQTVTKIERDPSSARPTSIALVLRALRDQGADVSLPGEHGPPAPAVPETAADPEPALPPGHMSVTVTRGEVSASAAGPVQHADALADAVWRIITRMSEEGARSTD